MIAYGKRFAPLLAVAMGVALCLSVPSVAGAVKKTQGKGGEKGQVGQGKHDGKELGKEMGQGKHEGKEPGDEMGQGKHEGKGPGESKGEGLALGKDKEPGEGLALGKDKEPGEGLALGKDKAKPKNKKQIRALGKAGGDHKKGPLVKEQRKHLQRMARIGRLLTIAKEEGDSDLKVKIEKLNKMEKERHEKVKKALKQSGKKER